MTALPPESGSSVNRRILLRNGLLVGLGATVASVAVPGLADGARAAGSVQADWFWCNKCTLLFWSKTGGQYGVCPKGGSHTNSGSYQYELEHDYGSRSGYQNGWRYCSACAVLFWGPDIDSSACPAQPYSHLLISATVYDLQMGGSGGQAGWNWCDWCQGLFHGSGNPAGFCWGRQDRHLPSSSTDYHIYQSG